MTIQEFQADKIEGVAKMLAFWLGAMPKEKQSWVPSVEGAAGLRTAREQVAECVTANRFFASLFKGEKPASFSLFLVTFPDTNTDFEEIQQALLTSAAECAASVRRMSDDDLMSEYPFRGRMMSGYQVLEFPYRNMAYHSGQINQLQLFYGDTEFHVPS